MAGYRATTSKIRQSAFRANPVGLDNATKPSIKDLAWNLTGASSSTSNATDIVDRFLSSTRLPSFDGVSSSGRGKMQIDSRHVAALVTFDLAICCRAEPEVSRELLRLAQGKLSAASTKYWPQSCTSLESFIADMIELLDVVTARQSASADLRHHGSLASLLASCMWPLAADDYKTADNGLVWVERALHQTHDVLMQHSMHPTATCSCSCTPDELLAHLADVCYNALPHGGLLSVLHRSVVVLLYLFDGRNIAFLSSVHTRVSV